MCLDSYSKLSICTSQRASLCNMFEANLLSLASGCQQVAVLMSSVWKLNCRPKLPIGPYMYAQQSLYRSGSNICTCTRVLCLPIPAAEPLHEKQCTVSFSIHVYRDCLLIHTCLQVLVLRLGSRSDLLKWLCCYQSSTLTSRTLPQTVQLQT